LAVDPGNCSAGRYAIFDPASGYVCDWLATGRDWQDSPYKSGRVPGMIAAMQAGGAA